MAQKIYKEGELGPGGFPVDAFKAPELPTTGLDETQTQELDLLGQKPKADLTFEDKKNLSFANTQYGYEAPTSTFSNLGNIGKADPTKLASAGILNAMYQQKEGRNATDEEIAKFGQNTVKDASNLILGQNISPFSDAPVLEGKPSEVDPTTGEEDVTGDLTTDIIEIDDEKKQLGYQEELDKLTAENDKIMAERDKLREEQKVIAEAEKEQAQADIEAGIEKRDKTQEEIEADQKLIKADQELERLGKINDELSSINESRAAFEAKMLAERGKGWRLKPSVINALNKFDKQTAAAESRKALLNNNLNNASIVIGNLYQSKLDILNDNESSYTKLYNMANNDLINLTAEEEKDIDKKLADIEYEKQKIQDKQDTMDELLEDPDIFNRATTKYGLDFDDEPEEMMRKIKAAEKEQNTVDGLKKKFEGVINIGSDESIEDIYTKIKNAGGTSANIEIIERDDGVFIYNKDTGTVERILGPEDTEDTGDFGLDADGNVVKKIERSTAEAGVVPFAERMSATQDLIYELWEDMSGWERKRAWDKREIGKSANTQRFEQAAQDYITANLRDESGAAIGPEEFAKANKTFIPNLFDKEATLTQKQEAIRRLTDGTWTKAGGKDEIVEQSQGQKVQDAIQKLDFDQYKVIQDYINNNSTMSPEELNNDVAKILGLTNVESDTNTALPEKVSQAETGDQGGQCGRYVNANTGLGVGDSFESKMAKMDSSITEPEAGMVFTIPYKDTGHCGFIVSVDGNQVTVKDSNWSLDEKVKTHVIDRSKIKGLTRVT